MAEPLKTAQVRAKLEELLAGTDDVALRNALDTLGRERAFGGLTWLWGPRLYARNKTLFRPLILSRLATFVIDDRGMFQFQPWKGEVGAALEPWLAQVDREDDIDLFKQLFAWKHQQGWRRQDGVFVSELLKRFKTAGNEAKRNIVLAKFDTWFMLDEATSCELHRIDPKAAAPFILKHLPRNFWGDEKRQVWAKLAEQFRAQHDETHYWQLYRLQTPAKQWAKDVKALCAAERDPARLVEELKRRHLQAWGLDLGKTVYELVTLRGRDVFPYVIPELATFWRSWGSQSGLEELIKLAEERGWDDLWSALLRVAANDKQFNREVLKLVKQETLTDDKIARRLLLLVGVAREWNFAGFGMAQVKQLDDDTALALYRRFPDLVRGPFRLNLHFSWAAEATKLLRSAVDQRDEPLIDYLASRLLTRGGRYYGNHKLEGPDLLADYYQGLKANEQTFSRRAATALSQTPAYSIFDYNWLIRTNRLARLFFERSAESYLADRRAMADLVEASEIHVQALAYRALGLDDPRAREFAGENLDILVGTLLRPLHRKTRLLAFKALLNAANTAERAKRVLTKAREALDLPDKKYPKEQLIGFIGQLLHRWPEFRGPREQPVVYTRDVARART